MIKTPITSESVVQRQLEAFNARDLTALLSIYADDAELFEYPSKLVARGTEELRARFSARFAEPNLLAKLVHRIVVGTTVIDHEIVTRTFPEGAGTLELVMIYEINEGRIAKAWSIPGEKRLAQN
ncbi:MAG: nuclear transport factor 2 family protein [Nibricoccus sp.]